MKRHCIEQSDKGDLYIQGEILAAADAGDASDISRLSLRLYKNEFGKYLLSSELNVNFPKTRRLCTAVTFSGAEGVREFLRESGKGIADAGRKLLEQAALYDDAFSPAH
jgi:hypothetical protein